MLRTELMTLPVGISSLTVMPVPRVTIVTDLFIGMLAQLPGKCAIMGHYPWGTIVRGLIPDIIMETIITVAHKIDVLGNADRHMKAQFGRLDKEWRLLVHDGRLLVHDSRLVIDRRGRDRDRHNGSRPGTDIDPEVKVDVGGKGKGYGESGGKRQTTQNLFHMTVPSLV
jgi:hypothetical protein